MQNTQTATTSGSKGTAVETKGFSPSSYGINEHGLSNVGTAYWNLGSAELVEHAVRLGEGQLAANGALVAETGSRTGRSPNDKFLVKSTPSQELVNWGKINVPIERARFDKLRKDMIASLTGKHVYVQDCFAGADPDYRLPIRVITEYAWHSLFARTMFVRPPVGTTGNHVPDFTILGLPSFQADPVQHGTHSEAFVIIDFEQHMILLGGLHYAGEIKKSVFTIMNHLLPQRDVLPMHCSANVGSDGDTALFFGLSGTGKTTLSADPKRRLIGDDEHGWSPTGIFNFEGGCYAKCIKLSEETEPQIYRALKFGSVLENVIIDPVTRLPDYDDDSRTENTRAGYPLEYIDNIVTPSIGGHPKNVVFLTCDAFGVLPPISRLTEEQAMYHFLSGYTAKVAGTEAGITEPQATFSSLFGAPFFTQKPMTYARMLADRLKQHGARCWLVNTGWTGGPYGVGQRMSLPHTRVLLNAALGGALDNVEYTTGPVFGLKIPKSCPDVPAEVLVPQNTWNDKAAYQAKNKELAERFKENFKKFEGVPAEVLTAGPQ